MELNIQSRSLKFSYVRLLYTYRMKTVRGSLSGVWEFGIKRVVSFHECVTEINVYSAV